jgi:hypothetical protein
VVTLAGQFGLQGAVCFPTTAGTKSVKLTLK